MSIAPASWCCATAAWSATIFPCWRAPAATAASSAPPGPNRSIPICARWWKPPSGGASTNSSISARCSTSAPAAGARSWCCCRPSAQLSETDRSLVEIFGSRLSIAFDNVILYQQLHEANTQLEDRVAQRTRALMQANRRLSAQWLRLQRANGFKNEILGTVAHDLKNPLGVILGRTEMLTELIGAGSSKESVTAQVEHIRDATKRLTSMVDHLISDAMADAFDITIRREPVDIAALVGEVADANQPSAVNKQQTITVAGAAQLHHHVRCRPDARGHRQSHQQCHQIQPDRRQDFGAGRVTIKNDRYPHRRRRRRPVAGGSWTAVRPLPAALRQTHRRRKLDRTGIIDRQAHYRHAWRPRLRPTAPGPDRDRPSPSYCPQTDVP